jgi:hypothetical protein
MKFDPHQMGDAPEEPETFLPPPTFDPDATPAGISIIPVAVLILLACLWVFGR